ncbi:MAG: TonB-dependent receptor [Wenzhouxiangellaceae bacterium]|nr:TonB-dependent receptor [Wenzhouxiangellaceae bacterium]
MHWESKINLQRALIALASACAVFLAGPSWAQEDEEEESATLEDTSSETRKEEQYLDKITVTGSVRGRSKFRNSRSINTLSDAEITRTAYRNAAEVLRTIPGVRSEASAGEGNTNISVRGVPIAAGGSKFVQLQEDGMPILQFGDIIVGTSDQFLRLDNTLERIEVLKGSSAATLASNSPAGVINFISKTGQFEESSVRVTSGLTYDSARVDFDYGGPIGRDWRFHVGGFYRDGEGVRDVPFDASEGGQIKANITREFNRGYVRAYFKYLNDNVPTYLPMPMTAGQSSVPGLDAKEDSNISRDLGDITSFDVNGKLRRSSIRDGNESEVFGVGLDIKFDVGSGFELNEKFRFNDTEGTFFGAFTADIGSATDIESLSVVLNGTGADGLAFVSGPNAGQVMTGAELADLNGNGLLQNIRTFDNDLKSLDNFTNDLSLTRSFDYFDVTAGYYRASQDIDVNWFWQTFLQDVSDEARLVDVFAGDQQLTTNGQLAFGAPDWGNCCTRDTSLETDIDAFYLAVSARPMDGLDIDASVRYDDGEGTGHYAFASEQDLGVGPDAPLAEQNVAWVTTEAINASRFKYDWSYWSYSLAANYTLNDSTAVFASYSEGSRANADRLGDGGFLENGGVVAGSVENDIMSTELGFKYQNRILGVFATGFYVETDDANSESKGDDNRARIRTYESLGIEVEGVMDLGDFSLRGAVTYTDAEIDDSNDPSLIGNTPRRQADWVWSFSPSYYIRDHSIGATIIGTTDSYSQDDNSYEMDGYTFVNLFADFHLTRNMALQLTVNNLFDEIGVTEAEGGFSFVDGERFIRARSIAGRTVALALTYQF